ncbi:carbon-monoxide dehydrogenase medium subunit [Amycolatopsis bartoniae]|uniref:Carbon monoxide dehydrogenase medium subunit n=1 Tax=Amycolatopsis bartoniae TaxID=941986 RepID=A0A8H9J120_9PSEU|nr:xanthine dehydrogenase family protein subunit M [Amycolatopsis bartoniae]MBB2935741.1 carbon-monoxide dehydrogenase medium subunit [Amycolatopsis bartoniae]TVT05847.1 xanthine dehydrogenase family protein subunit M [Amycolatopsis bartoniae]GHF61558.1 carbon monoxide dehydrogenase medium subunit [Amycolatopsis bartoniae]
MQVPAQFQYERATSVEHALSLLGKYGPESRIVAGGHSLIPMMKLRLAQPQALVDINEIAELARISVDGQLLCIGAMARHADLLASALAGEHFPIFHDAEKLIADPVVRNRGTVGGSLCQADPSEDLSAAFAAVRAEAVIQGENGQRVVPIREFFTGPYETAVGDGELLVQVRVPIRSSASAYRKVERRAGDWAVAAAGAELRLEDGVIAEAGIGLTAVGAANFHAPEAEEFLVGGPATAERFERAGAIAAEHCAPVADQRGPVDYKRHLAATLTARALAAAAARWHGRQEA